MEGWWEEEGSEEGQREQKRSHPEEDGKNFVCTDTVFGVIKDAVLTLAEEVRGRRERESRQIQMIQVSTSPNEKLESIGVPFGGGVHESSPPPLRKELW
jgi:hypothetical protein